MSWLHPIRYVWSYPREWKILNVGDEVVIDDKTYVVSRKIRRPHDRQLHLNGVDGFFVSEFYNNRLR